MSYLMPAEWRPQTATWLSWPHNVETWPENLAAAQAEFVEFARTIAKVQAVKILAAGDALAQAVAQLAAVENIELIAIPTNDAWARDYAPTFVQDQTTGELTVINWRYNAWGGKYPPFDDDQRVAEQIAKRLNLKMVSPDLCFEGGAIEVNDAGLMLCTTSCALDPNRNPGRTREEVESIFRETLGVDNIIWLPGDAIAGDDTDGHIDQLARFTDDQTIVYAWCKDESDPQFGGLEKNRIELERGLKTTGQDAIRLIELPIPPEIHLHERRVPASYCNFLICNGLVIVPQFGDAKHDSMAMKILSHRFPRHRTIGLNSVNLSVGLGSFHCLSQHQPAV